MNLLNTKEVADYLNASEKWVREAHKNRQRTKFPKAKKIGKGFKWLKDDVSAWVKVHA